MKHPSGLEISLIRNTSRLNDWVSVWAYDDVAAVHWVVTVPDARNRGIGAAMTLAALRDARQMGYEVSILTASPLGAGIYKRIGFKAYCTIRKYEWTPHGQP